jgi:hypothetical protein
VADADVLGARVRVDARPELHEGIMKTFSIALIVSVIGLALAAAPAEAAKSNKHKKSAGVAHVKKPRQAAAVATMAGFQGGVRAGPLYNGPDYIGDDPDPSIRAYLIKDMTRYQGSY